MAFLKLLESIRIPALDKLMQLVTMLGEESIFLVVALILFWCINKKWGYYIMSVGFLGTTANQFLKIFCRVPRPWVLDPGFTIVESAREGAAGYSFPSGHSQSAVGTYGAIAVLTNKKWVRWTCIIIAVLVPFSRMYLGVHTPKDVLVGAAMALILLLFLRPMAKREDNKWMHALLPVMAVNSAAFLLFTELYSFPADIDSANFSAAIKNAYTLFGAVLGLAVVYFLDEKKLHFQVRAVWWAQILKLAGGVMLVLFVKTLLKTPLYCLFRGHHIADALRYFLVVLVAGTVWPMSFTWFSRLGKKKGTGEL